MTATELLGVVLCGGRSRRMGRDKAMLTLADGRTFLQQAASRVAAVSDDVVISATATHGQSRDGYRIIADDTPGLGPVGGVAATLKWAHAESFEACLFTPIDMPGLTVDDLERIKAAWRVSPHLPVCAKCEDRGTLQPLVAIYPVPLIDLIETLAASEDRSLFRWLRRTEHREVTLAANACHNINAPEDLPD